MLLAPFGAALLVAVVAVVLLVPRLHRAGITGRDMNKPRRNKIPRGRPHRNTPVMYDSPREIHETPPISTGQAGVDTTRGKSDGVDNPEDIPRGLPRAVTSDHSTSRGRAVYPEVAEMGWLA